MTSNPDVIEISSDSSPSTGWSTYFPPISTATSSSKKKGKAKKVDSSSDFSSFDDSLVSSYDSSSEEDDSIKTKGSSKEGVSKKATLSHTAAIPPQSITGKRVQVIGLANVKTWEAIQAKQFGVKKPPTGTGPSAATKGKGKRSMV
ncbi:hypothetical protein CTI12_AA443740 [Artemisia annua]|uniref:Uncharacterized protein n=1 Tax=Artemisia annua TaxID=35608 RepID=A0A2U1KWP3_ARTAN|nr:hypothetical protein CTI12_AA443740 [Artemisia annua]